MDPNTAAKIQALMSIAQTVLIALTFIGGVVVSVLLFKRTNKLTSAQYMRSTFDAWLASDTFFLHKDNEESLKILTMILSGVATSSSNTVTSDELKKQRERLTYFIILNPLYSYFYALNNLKGHHYSWFHSFLNLFFNFNTDGYKEMEEKFDESMKLLLKNEELYKLTQSEVFVEGFAKRCKKIKDRI